MKKALCLLIAGVIALAWGVGWYIEESQHQYGAEGAAAGLIVIAACMTIGGAVMTAVRYKSK